MREHPDTEHRELGRCVEDQGFRRVVMGILKAPSRLETRAANQNRRARRPDTLPGGG